MTPAERQQLIERALEARNRAYAPYSRFSVGAAVLTDSGQIHAGCNVENASYGLTICAERAAIFQAITAGSRRIVAIAVASQKGASPCGACRQVLAEFAEDLPVLIVDADHPQSFVELRLIDLLPHCFRSLALDSSKPEP
jgi:cytidine deaminase